MSATSAGESLACPACGTDNPGVARFCMSCGGSLEVGCPNCGTELPPAARFCFSCGHEIEDGATTNEPGAPSQTVTSEIADELRRITSGAGERRTITLMFCDVAGSTATAEKLDPEAWADIMHEAMDCFVASVERYGGTVARLLGDAILAYFGAPIAHEDDPQRAVLAALAILDCSGALCQQVQKEHGTDFNVRIGINTGLVVVGEMGSQSLTEYAALGDAANVAARMEQTAGPGEIRIAEATHRLVAPLFETEDVGQLEVKGRSDPVGAFTVISARGKPGQVRGIEGLTSPLVGREDELERLLEAVAASRSGAGRIVSVIGEAGLGKSRLVEELRQSEGGEGLTWLVATSHSYEDATPYAPYVPALHELFGLDDLPADERADQVVDFVVDLLGGDGRQIAPYLCLMLGLTLSAEDQKTVEFMDPGTLRSRIFDAVATLLSGLAEDGPLVLELEDLHWADPTSIDLTEHVLELAERSAILILLLFRPRRDEPSWTIHETAARRFAHRHVTVALTPLTDEHARSLVTNLLRVEGLSDSVRETILRKSEGNPFFVEEVIRTLLDAGVVVNEDGRFVATADIDDVVVPDTLAAVLATRLDKLTPAMRLAVQTASVLGRDFSKEMLSLLVDPELDMDEMLAELQRRELIVEKQRDPEIVLTFKHELTRDTAYGALLRSVRRDLHRMVGELVEDRHPDRTFELARHFDEAGDEIRAVRYLVEAGEQSFKSFAIADAIRYLRRALDLWEDVQDIALARRAYETLGSAYMFSGRMDEAIRNFEEMLTFAQEHDDVVGRISALNKGGLFSVMGGQDAEVAEGKLLEAKSLAEEADLKTGVAEFHVGYCYLNVVAKGDIDKAEEHLGEAAEVCFTLDPRYRNFGLLHYADALIYQTRFDEARDAVRRAREQSELDEDYEHLAGALTAEGMLQLFTGNPGEALPAAAEGLALADRIGNVLEMVTSAWAAGAAAMALGRLEQARELFTASIEAGQASGYLAPSAAAAVGMGAIQQWTHGPMVDVAPYFDQARGFFATPMGGPSRTGVFAQMGLAYLRRAALEEAERALDDAVASPSAFTKLYWPEVLICRGGLAFARGETDRASRLFHEAAELVDDRAMNYYRPRALLGLAMAAHTEDDAERMRELLHAAEDEARQRELRLDCITIDMVAADLSAGVGHHEDSAAFRAGAGEMIAEVASLLDDADMRRSFLRANVSVG